MPPDTSVDPYTAARQEWTERYSDFIYATILWRRATFAMAGVSAVLAVSLVVLSSQSKTELFVVKVDDLGTVASVGRIGETSLEDRVLYRAQLATFIRDWRTVVGDQTAQKQLVARAHALVRGAAAARLQEEYQASSPFESMKKATLEVELSSIVDRGDRTFEVIWRERVRALDGRLLGIRGYRGIFELSRAPDFKPDFLNGLGIHIVRLSYTEERS